MCIRDSRYTLALIDAVGRPLCDAWPLRTFPAPGDQPDRLRVLFYTCAGGHDLTGRFLSVATRARLLDRIASVKVVEFADGFEVATAQAALGGSCRVSLVEVGLSISAMASTPM